MKRVYFTEEELLRGWNHVDLDESGDFFAVYFAEDNGQLMLYGYWDPTKEAAEIEHINPNDGPFWSCLSFVPERELDEIECASDATAIPWYDWIISIVEEEEEQ